jgi:hypothetical protein
MLTSLPPILVVGIITSVSDISDSGERTVELYTDLGPVDVIVSAEHAADDFVLYSPAVLPVDAVDGTCGSQLRFAKPDVSAEAALQTA